MVSPAPSAGSLEEPRATAGPGRPKDLAKRAAILDAAKQLFIRDGFSGTSMDHIAHQAGVSKLTVYSHFGDKESLFAAAIRDKCEQLIPDELFQLELNGSVRDRLRLIAGALFDVVSSEESIGIRRMLLTPGHGNENLRRIFWEAGPGRTQAALASLLQAWTGARELEVADPVLAAEQFITMVKGELHARLLCGMCAADPTQVARHLDNAVGLFLRAYAVR